MMAQAGDRLGPYLLLEVVGTGGHTTVCRAAHEVLGLVRAVRVLAPRAAADAWISARFLRVTQLAAQLESPHALRVLDAGETNGEAWFATEWIDGATLASALDRGRSFTAAEVRRIGAGIALALSEAHSLGLTHTAIRPTNIFITEDGTARLGDFGIETGATTQSVDGATAAAAYMAPEQEEGTASAASDVFALGAVLFHAWTGRRPAPFGREAPGWPRAAEDDPELRDVIGQMLHAEPDGRPSSRRAVRALAEPGPTMALTVTQPEAPRRRRRPGIAWGALGSPLVAGFRRIRWTWAAAVAALLVVGGTGAFLLLDALDGSDAEGTLPTIVAAGTPPPGTASETPAAPVAAPEETPAPPSTPAATATARPTPRPAAAPNPTPPPAPTSTPAPDGEVRTGVLTSMGMMLRPAWSPDMRAIVVATPADGEDDGAWIVLDPSTGEVTAEHAADEPPAYAWTDDVSNPGRYSPDGAWSAVGAWIQVGDGEFDEYLAVVLTDAQDVEYLIKTERSAHYFAAFSPDGEYLSWVEARGDGLSLVVERVDALELTPLP